MIIYKNRTHYAQHINSVPTTWEQKVVDRVIEWDQASDGVLSYRVIGNRVNHNGLIVMPEHSKVVLHEGTKKTIHTPLQELLQALADSWSASVTLPDGTPYRGHNAHGEGPETAHVMTCSTGTYPYFQHS